MKNSKFVNLLFLAAGAIVWFISLHYFAIWSAYFQLPRRVGGGTADTLVNALPIVLWIGTFAILRANRRASQFVGNCIDELVLVVFPGAREVRIGTFWVTILVILSGMFFGGLDWCIVGVVKYVIGIRA